MTAMTLAIERVPPSPRQVFLQRLVSSLWSGLFTGLLFGMLAGVAKTLEVGALVMLLTSPTVGVMDWWMGGIMSMSFLKPVEALKWSWQNVSKYLVFSIIGSTPMGLLLGLTGVLGRSWVEGLLLILLADLVCGLLIGLRAGAEVETRTISNQGIWRSIKTSVTVATIVSMSFSLMIHLLNHWLVVSPGWGVFYGTFLGLLMGGTACLIHISLRIVFWLHNAMPWNYARFLDYAVDRIFLQKVGGGYIFIHRLLMEHFAAMSVEKRR